MNSDFSCLFQKKKDIFQSFQALLSVKKGEKFQIFPPVTTILDKFRGKTFAFSPIKKVAENVNIFLLTLYM